MPKRKKTYVLSRRIGAFAGCAAIVSLLIILIIVRHTKLGNGSPSLPPKVVAQVSEFTPYYFSSELPKGFTLDENNVSYNNNVLFIRLHNKSRGQTINITEQALPQELSASAYSNATKVNGADGDAIVKYDGKRIVGGLFSAEHKGTKTFVIITTTDSLPQMVIEDMLRDMRSIQ